MIYQNRGDLDIALEMSEKALVIDAKRGPKEGIKNRYRTNPGLLELIK